MEVLKNKWTNSKKNPWASSDRWELLRFEKKKHEQALRIVELIAPIRNLSKNIDMINTSVLLSNQTCLSVYSVKTKIDWPEM